jgi:hypothetical protein
LAKITENREENGQKCFENLKKKKKKKEFQFSGQSKKKSKYVIEIFELRVFSEKLDKVMQQSQDNKLFGKKHKNSLIFFLKKVYISNI